MSRAENVVVQKRMSFLSSLVWSISSVLMVALVCVAAIIFYGMTIVGTQASSVVGLLDGVLEDLPAFAGSVPFLADAVRNERRLDYVDAVNVRVSFSKHPHFENRMMPVLSVTNNGKEQVALLHMRVIVRDRDGNILEEAAAYVATPIAFDEHDAPGPLMPGSTRLLSAGSFKSVDHPVADYEITDIRVAVEQEDEHAVKSVPRGDYDPLASR